MTKNSKKPARRTKPLPLHKRALAFLTGFTVAQWYAAAAVLVLFATTLYWALLGARLNMGNADQLSSAFLFENGATFHGAEFPAQHTFLLKWPLFYLLKLAHFSAGGFTFLTVLLVLVTVAGLTYCLFRINRRPVIFGTLCLALASVLLLVPAQPYAGGLLPVNLAMLTTRNIEYALYVCALTLFARKPHPRGWQFWLATAGLALLIASDKLFLTLSVGGALLALVTYALARGWKLVSFAVYWLLASGLALVAATAVLWALQALHVTNIAGQSGTVGPYGLVHTGRDAALALTYAVSNLLTNLGANPAYDATLVRQLPHNFVAGLFSPSGPAYLVNMIVAVLGLAGVLYVLRRAFTHNRYGNDTLDAPSRLTLALIWSTLAAVIAFVATNHYYAVDARYLGLAPFTVFLALAVLSRRFSWQPRIMKGAAVVLFVSVLIGAAVAHSVNQREQHALAVVNGRNSNLSQALTTHHVVNLVGDYWRVLPVKQGVRPHSPTVMPLYNCTTPRNTLTSLTWQPDLHHHSFAYLLSLDRGLTDYPTCSLNQVVRDYGRPNASIVIAGSYSHPREQLLFYDQGIHKVPAYTAAFEHRAPTSVVPVKLADLPSPPCARPTIMTIVAHEDDDLLFTNPDLQHLISSGHCARTVYLTAGDAGHNQYYWLGRELGSQAAYSYMYALAGNNWVQRIVQISDRAYVVIDSPVNEPRVSLLFFHLPDGSPSGRGFGATHNQSLAKLVNGQIPSINAVDGQSQYSLDELKSALVDLFNYYGPAEIHTQSTWRGSNPNDHSDHNAVGEIVKQAYARYEDEQFEGRVVIPIKYYIGYPSRNFTANVGGSDLQAKQAAFLAYAGFDGSVCHSALQCQHDPAYGAYLTHQEQNQE